MRGLWTGNIFENIWNCIKPDQRSKFFLRRTYIIRSSSIAVRILLIANVLVEVLSRYGEVSFKTFEQADYLTAPIGKFIEDSVINGERKRDYADKGTLKGKLDFCEKAVAAMDSYDDLSSEAKDVTMRLYEFIAKNNM